MSNFLSGNEANMGPTGGLYTSSNYAVMPVGSRFATNDGCIKRVFYYGKTVGTVYAGYGAYSNTYPTMVVTPTYPAAAYPVGSYMITIANETKTILKDSLVGGIFVCGHDSATTTQNRVIVGNGPSATTPGTEAITLYLDGGLSTAITTSTPIEIMVNPYQALLVGDGADLGWVAGVPALSAVGTASVPLYLWFQTWGPAWLVPGGGWTAGNQGKLYERAVYFVGDGSVNGATVTTFAARGSQLAGYIIQKDTLSTGGPPFVNLQISL